MGNRVAAGWICSDCAVVTYQWFGRCPGCGAWNSLTDLAAEPGTAGRGSGAGTGPVSIGEVDVQASAPWSTGLAELDRILGGGLTPQSITLIGGEPGIGKSTLCLQVAMAAAGRGLKVLMATGEEPVAQVAARARRIGRILPESLFVMRATDISTIFTAAQAEKMDLVVLDSVQTVTDPEVVAPSGSPGQVRAVAQAMVALGKTTGAAVLIVGHVTKDGALAGPKFLEHLVDSVLSFEGQGGEELRVLRVNKHRFGTTTDVALFRMGPSGLAPLADPSGSFLRDRQPGLPGSAVLAAMIGTRPTLVEVQALVAYGSGQPRRVAQGLEVGRLALVLAVLEQRAQVDLASMDVYASVTGGIRVSDPGIDMAVALAVASAFSGVPLPATLACAGEIGLGGEIRQVAGMTRRWAEATRLGFDRHIGPPGGSDRSASRADIVGILNDLDLRPEIRPRLRPADSGQFRRVGG